MVTYTKAIEIVENELKEAKEPREAVVLNGRIASTYKLIDRPEATITYLRKALKLATENPGILGQETLVDSMCSELLSLDSYEVVLPLPKEDRVCAKNGSLILRKYYAKFQPPQKLLDRASIGQEKPRAYVGFGTDTGLVLLAHLYPQGFMGASDF